MSEYHDHHSAGDSSKSIGWAFLLNVCFTLLEVVGGILTGSIAVLADAVHDLGDSLFLGVAWFLERSAQTRSPDEQFTYGYQRLSLAAALINGVVLSIGSTLVLTQAIPRLLAPEAPHTGGMIGLAVLGICMNGWAAYRTHTGKTMNEQLVSWHLLEDVLGWVAVLVGAVVMALTKWWWIDAALGVGLAAFILFSISRKLWQVGRLFLQVSPPQLSMDELRTRLVAVNGVTDIHHLHVWSLDGEHHVASLHAQLKEGKDLKQVKAELREILQGQECTHIAIELDIDPADCSLKQISP